MRHFKTALEKAGYTVTYVTIKDGFSTLTDAVAWMLEHHSIDEIDLIEPSEYRLLKDMESWEAQFQIPVTFLADCRFLATHEMFQTWANSRKELRMEFFYRAMRKQYSILMDGDKPVGGKWNFDAQNRKPAKHGLSIPNSFIEKADDITNEVIKDVQELFSDHFGDIEPFQYAVTRHSALLALEKFIKERLPLFGDYQDAMIENEDWMFHAHIGLYLNAGLLLPHEVILHAEDAYKSGASPLNAVEGFIRQILGWREFVRGIYWLKMPDYDELNILKANRPLPDFYWTGNTDMNCLKQSICATKENAYAHHIQRLMILGNFALLAGISPKDVNEWFLIVYADAYHWVELPNVTGMALYADGGMLASKPYAAGGAYINRMSNYCENCAFDVKLKSGEKACPFNYLYWDFLARNADILSKNQRLGLAYRNLNTMEQEKKEAAMQSATKFLEALQ